MGGKPQKRRNTQRASDDDREIVAGDLRDAFAEGRLDPDEYQRRLDALWESRTYGELEALTVDLPQPIERKRAEAEQARRQKELAEYMGEWRSWLAGAVIMIGIWFFTNVGDEDGFNDFWPAIPLGIWGAILVAGYFNRD